MDHIFIADFTFEDRELLLECLWNNVVTSSEYEFSEFDIKIAKKQIDLDNGFADNICGKIIGLQIYGIDTIDPYIYESYNGVGTVKDIIDLIREDKKLRSQASIDTLLTQMEL